MKEIKIIVRGGVVEPIDVPIGTQLRITDYDNETEYVCIKDVKNGGIKEKEELQEKLFMEAGA